MFEEHRL